jgi:23S rRNA pseudouridine2605 synthase
VENKDNTSGSGPKKPTGKPAPLRGKKAAHLRREKENPDGNPSAKLKREPTEERPKTPRSKKRTATGAKNRTPAAVKNAAAEERKAAAAAKKTTSRSKKADNPPAKSSSPGVGAFGKFIPRDNPRVEKKNDRRRERMLLDEQKKAKKFQEIEDEMRLNRFIALSGICSRREADTLITAGKIKVNGVVTTEMGHKVTPGKDKVEYNRRELKVLKFVYLLMNKPKNLITTTKDELGRSTVMELVEKYTKVRIYPVGRLDRNTTGLILFTNDGELAKRLTHPSHKVKKMYHVRLDKDFTEDHLLQLRKGIELEDGPIKPDKIDYVDGGGDNEVGVELHSGRNRIVRRMFEHLGYEVVSLDRVKFGPLSKKNLPRGTCRFLDEKEIGFLKMSK